MVLLKDENRTKDCKVLSKIMSSEEDGSCTVKSSSVYSPREGLAMILDCRLSKQDYQTIRTGAKNKGYDIYPAYNHVLDAKEECIPSEGINATDYAAEVGLQELVDHTAKRILENVEIACQPYSTLTMIHKVGFDGSTGQSVYKQVTSEDCERAEVSREESLFLTCLVPLEIKMKENSQSVWRNDRPSSTLWCRPVRFRYIKESSAVLLEEMEYIKSVELQPTLVGTNVVQHKFEITMLDGKVATALSDATTSSQCCSICGLNPKRMNQLEVALEISKDLQPISFQYGLSTLHAWIRCMECCLHISYKLKTETWQARTAEDKAEVKRKKSEVQQKLKERLGLVVDIPKSGGSGTSNDGNTARRFFQVHIYFRCYH